MTNDATKKGNALEDAVRGIETAILRSSPSLQESTFKIESKRIFVIAGVRHEIDVYVEVDLGKGYKSIFIFECKNWEDAVGKNDIIIFSEKIDALQAQRGFFVAKSYSKDAEAQAKKDARIELLTATERNIADTPIPFDFHFIHRDKSKSTATVEFLRRETKGAGKRFDIELTASTIYKGQPLEIIKLIGEWVDELADTNLRTFPSGTLPEGNYERSDQLERRFEKDELVVNGMDIGSVLLELKFSVQVIRPALLSNFEIASRGRSIAFASVQMGDATAQVAFIFRS